GCAFTGSGRTVPFSQLVIIELVLATAAALCSSRAVEVASCRADSAVAAASHVWSIMPCARVERGFLITISCSPWEDARGRPECPPRQSSTTISCLQSLLTGGTNRMRTTVSALILLSHVAIQP